MNSNQKSTHLRNLPLALLALFLLLAACARTTPATHYSLSATTPEKPVVGREKLREAEIGIGPVILPEYLDRPQLVTREGANQLYLSEANRWAEPLAVSIPRTMRENLANALATEKIRIFPWSDAVDYQILIEIVKFEAVGSEMAHLEAIWSVQDAKGNAVIPQRRSEHQVPIARPGEEALGEGPVRALSQALALFSWEIADLLSGKASGK